MKNSIKFLRLIAVVLITGLSFTSCVKKDYDEPVTANVDPNLTAWDPLESTCRHASLSIL